MLKLLHHPLFLLLFTLASALFSFSLYQTVKKSTNGRQNVAVQEQERTLIAEENAQIAARLEQAQSPIAQEILIRNELLLQKPGERVIQIVEQTEYVPPPAQVSESVTPWKAWKELLFKK